MMDAPPQPLSYWPAVLAALGAMFVGIGLARFAYTPLMPAIVANGWFSAGDAAYLGAVNLVGYLAGALTGARLARRLGTRRAAQALMLVTTASFFACATPVAFAWFAAWRFVAGVTGGALMVIAAPSALRLVPAQRRGLAGGIVFTGVGLGIAASGTLTPLLVSFGLTQAWLAFAVVTLVVTLASWRAWPRQEPPRPPTPAPRTSRSWPFAATAVVFAYGLIAAGLVPHMVFLVDYVARGLNAGLAAGAALWVVFGLGAVAGPSVAGALADRIGFATTLIAALVLEAAAVLLPLAASGTLALSISSIAVGAFVPGCVPLTIGRLAQVVEAERQAAAWSRATVAFAVGQASAGYIMSLVFAQGGSYHALFALGATAFIAALGVNLLAGLSIRRACRERRVDTATQDVT